jgi:hypothetical protein
MNLSIYKSLFKKIVQVENSFNNFFKIKSVEIY